MSTNSITGKAASLTTAQHYADEATLTAEQMAQRDADPTGLFRGAEVTVDYGRKLRTGRVYEVSGNAVCVEVEMPRGVVRIVSSRDRVSRRFDEAVAR